MNTWDHHWLTEYIHPTPPLPTHTPLTHPLQHQPHAPVNPSILFSSPDHPTSLPQTHPSSPLPQTNPPLLFLMRSLFPPHVVKTLTIQSQQLCPLFLPVSRTHPPLTSFSAPPPPLFHPVTVDWTHPSLHPSVFDTSLPISPSHLVHFPKWHSFQKLGSVFPQSPPGMRQLPFEGNKNPSTEVTT